MSEARARLERLLGGPELAPLRERLRQRYELGRQNDAFTVTEVSVPERRALEGLLARRMRDARSIRLSIAELDAALARAGLAASLRDALAELDGPIHERAAERAERAARWEAVFASCTRAELRALAETSAGRALAKRLAANDPDRGRRLLACVARVLSRLPVAQASSPATQQAVPLSHFAAATLGDAHALDDGKPLATLVLAALRQGEAERAREVWARHGVLVGELAAPALALNLEAEPDTPAGELVEAARARGEPLHLSLRALLRAPPRWTVRDRTVCVCENPAVIAMAADRLGPRCAPLVCTDGMPSAAQRTLLSQLSAAGARLRYHGDFDWPGIAIGNYVMREFGAEPWRFRASDFQRDALQGGRQLGDAFVNADWDADLAPAMGACGYALEEEAVIETLLEDLATSS
jgi:uncharacterized protein (TIGR02679 family)